MKKLLYRFQQIIIFCKYIYYKIYCKIYKIDNSDIWFISERGHEAKDNGYFFYKYLKKEHSDVKVKYLIETKSMDADKIDKGDLIEYGSKEHFILFITAGKLISTHIMGFSPQMPFFSKINKYIKVKGKIIFLQHGIIKDMIPFLTKKNINVDMFITGALPEYEYVKNNYGFDEKIIKYTGLARYDSLLNEKNNNILIMPTWRNWLFYIKNGEDFKKTEYFKRYSELINDKDIIDLLNEYNYNLIFYPHYEVQKYIECFKSQSKRVIIASKEQFDVQELLRKSSLLITDYSSVFFDFAYMKKPIIFFQFDYEQYRKKQYQEGYFDYKDSFGDVVTDKEDIIKTILKYIKENMKMNQKHLAKVNEYFQYNDKKNCERIFNEIIKL